MSSSDLESEYERLRGELELAYAEPVWNTPHIDRLANAIVDLEKSLMCHPILTEEAQQLTLGRVEA